MNAADEIRAYLGITSQAMLDAYNPGTAAVKLGSSWTANSILGTNPTCFKTKREAVEWATMHKNLMQNQFDRPEDYHDVVSIRARIWLKRFEQIKYNYNSEMEAAAAVKAELGY